MLRSLGRFKNVIQDDLMGVTPRGARTQPARGASGIVLQQATSLPQIPVYGVLQQQKASSAKNDGAYAEDLRWNSILLAM